MAVELAVDHQEIGAVILVITGIMIGFGFGMLYERRQKKEAKKY